MQKCPGCKMNSMVTTHQEHYSKTSKCMNCGFNFKPVFVTPEDLPRLTTMKQEEYRQAKAVLDEYYEQTQRKQFNPDNKKIIVSLG